MPSARQIAAATRDLVAGVPVTRDPCGLAPGHAAWLLSQVMTMPEGPKAHRWVGYAHALIVTHGLATLAELRHRIRRMGDQ